MSVVFERLIAERFVLVVLFHFANGKGFGGSRGGGFKGGSKGPGSFGGPSSYSRPSSYGTNMGKV